MALRPATLADLDVILRHRREMFREMGAEYAEQLDAFEDASRQYFEFSLRNQSYYGVVAEIQGTVVAGGGVVIVPWPGSPRNLAPRRAWILNIYVEREYRRQGLARSILEALIEWCRQNGFQTVALHASEQGRPLYQKLGFRSTSEMRLGL